MARRRRRGAGWTAALLLIAVGAAAAIWGPGLFRQHAYKLEPQSCTVTHGDYVDFKTAEQANNAAIISAVGMSYGFGVAGVTVGLATAIQESDLRNLDYGDRDSLGLFQQRPSQGWGEPEQLMDPHYASSKFYQALERVDGWEDMRVTDAAQAVQRSGFPEAYADHELEALAWATALTGGGATIDCHVPDGVVGSAQAFTDRVGLDFGAGRYEIYVSDMDSETVTLLVTAISEGEQTREAFREWAIATASTTGAIEASGWDGGWVNGEGRYVVEPNTTNADVAGAPSPSITVVIATG